MSWDPYLDQWERSFALLEQFKEREGHCNVPDSHDEDGVKLGRWLGNLRQAKKGNRSNSNLSVERVERLDKVGIDW